METLARSGPDYPPGWWRVDTRLELAQAFGEEADDVPGYNAGMAEKAYPLSLLQDLFAICRLDKDAPVPDWALGERFFSIARTPDELSIVCPQGSVPGGIDHEAGWRCLKVESPFDFDLSSVVSSAAAPLAREGVTLFIVATQDSDYLLVRHPDLEATIETLEEAGHRVDR